MSTVILHSGNVSGVIGFPIVPDLGLKFFLFQCSCGVELFSVFFLNLFFIFLFFSCNRILLAYLQISARSTERFNAPAFRFVT